MGSFGAGTLNGNRKDVFNYLHTRAKEFKGFGMQATKRWNILIDKTGGYQGE